MSLIDAAVVSLGDATAATSVPPRTLSRAISDQGPGLPPMVSAVTGTSFIEPGVTRVRKRGFVTGVKRGLALSRNFTVRWTLGGPDTWLVDQVEILGDDIFCQPGDSGSLVLMVLVLLHATAGPVSERDLVDWVEHSNPSVFRRDVLRPAHRARLIEYDADGGVVTISPLGIEEVDDLLAERAQRT